MSAPPPGFTILLLSCYYLKKPPVTILLLLFYYLFTIFCNVLLLLQFGSLANRVPKKVWHGICYACDVRACDVRANLPIFPRLPIVTFGDWLILSLDNADHYSILISVEPRKADTTPWSFPSCSRIATRSSFGRPVCGFWF